MLSLFSMMAPTSSRSTKEAKPNLGSLYDCPDRKMGTALDNPTIDYCNKQIMSLSGSERQWQIDNRIPVDELQCVNTHKQGSSPYGPVVKVRYKQARPRVPEEAEAML